MVMSKSQVLYTFLDDTIKPILEKVFFLYDNVTGTIISYINVASSKHQEITQYVKKTYTIVDVTVCENWMRLDFDQDGSVSVEDMKKSMNGLYEFLHDYDYIENLTTIKSQLYTGAIKYMKQELE
jgi:hypothetical protein